MTDFNGRVAVITGGANGMGEATAHTFARAGASVVIIDKDAERTPLAESESREAGGKVAAIVADVCARRIRSGAPSIRSSRITAASTSWTTTPRPWSSPVRTWLSRTCSPQSFSRRSGMTRSRTSS